LRDIDAEDGSMSWRIIVASSDPEQLSELKKGAEAIAAKIVAVGGSAEIQTATAVDGARGLLRGTQDEFVIVTASLAERQFVPNAQSLPGLSLVKEMQSRQSPPACILVSDRPEHRGVVKSLKRCRWLQVGPATDYIEDCVLFARDLDVWTPLEAPEQPAAADAAKFEDLLPATTARAQFALIEVDVPNETKFATVRYVINVDNQLSDVPTVPLGLNQKRVDELVEESRKLSDKFSRALKTAKKYELWQRDYRSLGERFFKLLVTNVFADHYATVKGATIGRQGLDVRLRFSLGRRVFDGLWESICNPARGHLMLEATITRRERDSIGSFPDARSGEIGPLNILVIGATLDDNSTPTGPDDMLWRKFWADSLLKALPHVENEIAAIKALEQSFSRVQVEVFSGEDRHQHRDEWSLAEAVKKHLEANPNRYDVLHFAGHALFATAKPKKPEANKRGKQGGRRKEALEDDRGYLVFSGYPRPRAVSIATVASWLKNTSVELVYLSCCRSSASRAAAEFARNSIRTTIGFSWDLDDKKAVDFTREFYDELLRNRLNVCSALRKAREDLHNEFENGDPIWASPVLLAQPSNWGHVEGVLRPPVRQPAAPLRP
jgi:CHAT domain